jgi:hypothetical protein
MLKITGIKSGETETCIGSSNDTVIECPIFNKSSAAEFIVITHNEATQAFRQFVRVRLPSNKYKA